MITERDLDEAIAECQGQPHPNANTCIKLAAYYIIKDYMVDSKANTSSENSFSTKSPEISYDSGTTFSDAIKGKKIDEVLEVFEELMTTLQAINPRLYASVMRKF